MTQPPIIIFAGDSGWQIVSGDSIQAIPSSIGATPAQISAEIAAMVGSATENVTLAIPASWCLSATVSLTGVPARNRRTSLLYRLELLLPFTAEDVAADYIFNEPDTALAICISTATIKLFIDAIEAEGILIASVLPASLFAAHSLLSLHNACGLVICQADKSIELFTSNQGKITSWYMFPAEPDDLRWYIKTLPASRGSAIACNLDATLLDLLKATVSPRLIEIDNRSIQQVVRSAISTGEPPPVNLRRDSLAPGNAFRAISRPLNEAVVAAILLVACICAAACWRAAKLEQLSTSNQDQQRRLFLQLFPGHAVSLNILSRLKSEDRALGNGNVNATNPLSRSALPVLQSVLTGIDTLPPQVRLQIDNLKVDDQKFSLDGIVKTRSDLTNVTDALQQTSRIKIDPPQTEQAAGKGLHITLNGISTGIVPPK